MEFLNQIDKWNVDQKSYNSEGSIYLAQKGFIPIVLNIRKITANLVESCPCDCCVMLPLLQGSMQTLAAGVFHGVV